MVRQDELRLDPQVVELLVSQLDNASHSVAMAHLPPVPPQPVGGLPHLKPEFHIELVPVVLRRVHYSPASTSDSSSRATSSGLAPELGSSRLFSSAASFATVHSL